MQVPVALTGDRAFESQGEKPIQIAALQAYFCTGARRKKRAPVDDRGSVSERTEIVRYDAAAAQRSQNLPKPNLAEPSSRARGVAVAVAVAVLRCPPSQHS